MVKRKKTKKPETNSFFVIILLIFIFILAIMMVYNLSDFLSVIESKTLYAKVTVSDRYGFDVNGSALTFGEVSPSGTMSREIFVRNDRNESVRIKIYSRGDISSFFGSFDHDFILGKNETRNVSFSVSIPGNTEYGVYEGRVIIEVRRLNFFD
jgi:hypothetical protein